jgi:hypothetical protein
MEIIKGGQIMFMKMPKKKSKLLYRFTDESRNKKDIAEELIKTILVKATPTSSCWWSKMKTRTDGFKNTLDAIKQKQINYFKTGEEFEPAEGPTSKTCPGILGLFKKSYLIKSPTEIVITIEKSGGYYFTIADSSMMGISVHESNQFYQEDNAFFKDKISLKFTIPVRFNTTDFGYMLTDPTYHNNSGCFIPMGIIDERYGKDQSLNLISFIDIPKDKETRTITIKAGDVMAYLVPFNDCDIKFSDDNFIAKRLKSTFQAKKMF